MATTTTTAVPAIKFATTTDITLLAPADIAKLTEVNFAAFTTQQQSDLNASQVGTLTAKQIAALPLKLLQPETLGALPTVGISSFDLKNFDVDQFSAMTPAQIGALTPAQLSGLTTAEADAMTSMQAGVLTSAQIAAFTPASLKLLQPEAVAGFAAPQIGGLDLKNVTADQFAALTTNQIKALAPAKFASLTTAEADALTVDQAAILTSAQFAMLDSKSVGALSGSSIEALSTAAIAGFTAKNIIGLTTDSISALTTDQAAVLTSQQIAALPSKLAAEIPVDNIAVLTPAAIKGFTKANIGVLDLTNLSSEQFGAFTPQQTGLLSSTQLSALTSDFAPLLTSKAISLLTAAQLGALTTDVIGALDPVSVKGFTVKNIKGLTTDQITAITPEQSVGLSKAQLKTFATDQVGALSVNAVLAIKPAVFKSLNDTLMANLKADAFPILTENQLSSFTASHIAGLKSTQVAGLTGSQLAFITPTALSSLNVSTIGSLSADAVASLTVKQLGRFTTASAGQLESFVPSQVSKFSSDAKTWLTATKDFTTVESVATTGKGIYTSGAVVGGVAAETITSGTGNDTITTDGALADKIISGAGTDTISITGDVHSVEAGDGIDTLNITAFAGNFAKISGVEIVKLAAAGAGQTLALSGTTNAFTTVNADVLTDGQSLGITGSYSGNKVAVSLVTGDLDANTYTGTGLNVTATTGSNIIKTGSGADSILSGAGTDAIESGAGNDTINGGADNDTINGGAGVDSMTGDTGSDTFIFTTASNGAASAAAFATGFDTITDYNTSGSDVIDFVNTLAVHATTNNSYPIAGTAKISALGVATFTATTTALVDKITAVEAATAHVANSSAIFTDVTGTDAYVFISDAVSGVGTGDVLIKLAGKGAVAKSLGISADGDITSITAYGATTNFSALSPSAAVYVVDGGATITANMSGAATKIYESRANIDVIDANDTATISMTYAQEQAITAAKLAADDVVHIVDTKESLQEAGSVLGTNVIDALIVDKAKIDVIDVEQVSGAGTADAITITYEQAVRLIAAGLKFGADDVVTITGITDGAAVSAAVAWTTDNLGGASIVLTGDSTVSLTQAEALAQNASTKWAASQALTVTAANNAGEAIISALDKAVLGGSGITLAASADATANQVTLTQAEAKAQALITGTSWSSADAVTVTVDTSSTTKIAEAAGLSASALGGSSVILDTGATDTISLTAAVIATQLSNGADWKSDVDVTITNIGDATAISNAQAAYNTTTIGGHSVALDAGLSITQANLTAALLAGQKFTGTLNVTAITNQALALSGFTTGLTGASSIVLAGDASNHIWSIAAAALSTAMATNKQTFASTETLSVTAATATDASLTAYTSTTTGATSIVLASSAHNDWSVSKSALTTAIAAHIQFANTETVTVASIADGDRASALNFTAIETGGSMVPTGALAVVLDSVATTNAWTVAQAALPPSTVTFDSNDVVTVTVTTESTASALSTHVLGGASITLDGDGTVSLTSAEAAAQKLNNTTYSSAKTTWKSDDAVTVTGIASGDEATAIANFTKATLGGSGVTLTASDNTFSVAATDLVTALDASNAVKFASTTTALNVTTGIASGLGGTGSDALAEAYALTHFTKTLTGASGASSVTTLTAGDSNWSVSKADLTTALAEKIKLAGALTVTGISSADSTTNSNATLTALTTTLTGATSVILDSAASWTVAQADVAALSGVKFGSDVVNVTTTNDAGNAAASAFTITAKGGSSIVLHGDGTVSLADTVAAAQDANTTWASTDALTVTGIVAATEDAALTAYTTTILGGSSVTLDNFDANWSVGSAALTTALGAGVNIKFMAGDALTVAVADGDRATSLTNFTPTATGVTGTGSIVLDSATANAWAIAYSALPATNVTFGTDDVVTVTVPNANEAAASLLSTAVSGSVTGETVIGGASIVLNGDNAVSLTAAQATDQIALANTKWNTDDAVTVTGIATGDQITALQNYRKSALGGTSLVLETTVSGGWTVDEDSLQSALAAAGNTTPASVNTGNKLALHTVGALTDAVTITGIIIANETNALTVYDKSLLGAESVVLDAADNSWSVAEGAMTTALSKGIKFANLDTLTVTAATSTGLTAFTSAKTGAGNVVLNAAGDTWSIAGSALTTALAANIKVDTTDVLTVTGITTESTAPTAFTKALTGASSVVLGAADTTWSLASDPTNASGLELALLAGIKFKNTDKVTVTAIDTSTSVKQAAALAAYTTAKVGGSAVVLDAATGGSSLDAWSMTESALAKKAADVTFSNSDTLTVADISSAREATVVGTGTYIYTTATTGAKTVTLDAADDTWSITGLEATAAITAGVKFGASDAVTITGTTATLATAPFAGLMSLKGASGTITVDIDTTGSAPTTDNIITLSVVQAKDAMTNGLGFATGDTVKVTMTTADDALTINTANHNLGAAAVSFVYGGTSTSTITAGGVTFHNVADTDTAAPIFYDLVDTDYFTTANMDVITGFSTAAAVTAAGSGVADKINLHAYATLTAGTLTAVADTTNGDLSTTGDLMADNTYDIIVGNYDSASGVFTASSAAVSSGDAGTVHAGTLVIWDGDTTGAVDMVGVVLVGVTDLSATSGVDLILA